MHYLKVKTVEGLFCLQIPPNEQEISILLEDKQIYLLEPEKIRFESDSMASFKKDFA